MCGPIKKVAILGSGVMGSAIAAHLANVGIKSLVLDIIPAKLAAKQSADGQTIDDQKVRNSIADQAVNALLKTKPAPLFTPGRRSLIQTGNFTDDLAGLKDADWVIEVVKEDMQIKKRVLQDIIPHLKSEVIISSNTSGLSLTEMASVLPETLRSRFLGTHFFNPPRYMKLFELIPTKETAPEIVSFIAKFARTRLGKGIVLARDTPNFIANRVGVHAMMATMRIMAEMDLSIEEVDALTGPAIGRPKTATFKLADLVGLDTFLHVADNIYPLIPDDEARDEFMAPDLVRQMVKKGLLGRKSGGGFYKLEKIPEKKILTLDTKALEFRDKIPARFAELETAKNTPDLTDRLNLLVWGNGRASEAIWKMLAASFSYSAMRVGEICHQAADIDQAVRWGFNWDLGPFEIWDKLGFRKVTERLKNDALPLPGWIESLYESGAEFIYQTTDNILKSPTAEVGKSADVPIDERYLDFEVLRRNGAEVKRNPGASLIDLGSGVLGLEFHSKMNSIGQDTMSMLMTACTEAEKNWQALVVVNGADNFSVGANLMMLLMEAMERNWDDINMIVRAFQSATSRLEQCGVPVVVAPAGLALGGGCEVTMGGNAVQCAAETYIGLVEFGAGVIPAGGGCLRLYQRQIADLLDQRDLQPAFRSAFETIGMAKVATSAEEARNLGFLRPGDKWSMNRDHLAADARDLALAMAQTNYISPDGEQTIPVMGTAGIGLADAVLYNMREAGYISEHDQKIGRELAFVLSGGAVPPGSTITETDMLNLERESFLRLLGERKTLERMQYILKTGKPLRN